jgi:hypothetical protein
MGIFEVLGLRVQPEAIQPGDVQSALLLAWLGCSNPFSLPLGFRFTEQGGDGVTRTA